VAVATGTTVTTLHYEPLFKELINDPQLLPLFQSNLALLGETATVLGPEAAGGSTDVGNVSHRVPTLHPDIGIGNGCSLVAHTPDFAIAAGSDYAQERLLVGAKAMAMTAIDLLDL
jgi:metal-dependent amidase/aminoacylase/carboxypeptidase family protein